MSKEFLFIFFTFCFFNNFSQELIDSSKFPQVECDTIIATSGKVIIANIQKERTSKYVYFLCCEGCTARRVISKEDVRRVYLAGSNKDSLESENELMEEDSELDTLVNNIIKERVVRPISITLALGGKTSYTSLSVEYQLSNQLSFGTGYGILGPYLHNITNYLAFQSTKNLKHQFVWTLGVTHSFESRNNKMDYEIYGHYFLGYQPNIKRTYFRFMLGVLIGEDMYSFGHIFPMYEISLGFKFGKEKTVSSAPNYNY